MARPDDEFTDEPPRRRRRDEEDLEDDRPRRRRHEDDEDDEIIRRIRRHPDQLTGMDGMFANTSMVGLILFAFCCGGVAFILGVIGLCVCKDPRARQNALIVTLISGIFTALSIIGRIGSVLVHK